jgi:hypothetical protein
MSLCQGRQVVVKYGQLHGPVRRENHPRGVRVVLGDVRYPIGALDSKAAQGDEIGV